MRTGIMTDTYNLGMNRSYVLNYKITDNLKSNYKKNVSSDLDFYMEKYGFSFPPAPRLVGVALG